MLKGRPIWSTKFVRELGRTGCGHPTSKVRQIIKGILLAALTEHAKG